MRLKSPAPASESNHGMLPLINIVFLLMIFFMLVGAVSVPDAFEPEPIRSEALRSAERDPHSLLISADGRFALGPDEFRGQEIEQVLSRWRIKNPDQALSVRAGARVRAEVLLNTIEAAKRAGVQEVVLLTRRRP